jgi:hypothetical protein
MMLPFPSGPTESAGADKAAEQGPPHQPKPQRLETAGRDERALNMNADTPLPGAAPCDEGRPGPNAAHPYVGGRLGLKPASVALRLEGEQGAVALLDAEDRAIFRVGLYPEEEVIAAWQAVGLATGLPLVVQAENGEVVAAFPQIGRVRLGTPGQRRRLVLLAGRRPRFLTRRKTGRFPRRPRVHREPELVTGLGA